MDAVAASDNILYELGEPDGEHDCNAEVSVDVTQPVHVDDHRVANAYIKKQRALMKMFVLSCRKRKVLEKFEDREYERLYR